MQNYLYYLLVEVQAIAGSNPWRSIMPQARRLFSADSHCVITTDQVKQNLAAKFHDDWDAGMAAFTAGCWDKPCWSADPCLSPDAANRLVMPFSTIHFLLHHGGASRICRGAVPVKR